MSSLRSLGSRQILSLPDDLRLHTMLDTHSVGVVTMAMTPMFSMSCNSACRSSPGHGSISGVTSSRLAGT